MQKRMRSMKKNVMTSARLLVDEATDKGFRGRWAMLTLTYRDDVKWVAKQVSALLEHLRKYATRKGWKFRCVWVLELTQRGRPHYHVLVWLPKGRTLPKPDKQGWWKHGMTRVEWVKKSAVGYIAKYVSKGIEMFKEMHLPKGARLSGNGGLNKDSRIELRWWKLPTWVREVFNEICDVTRAQGGYVQRRTSMGLPSGEFLASPYRVVFLGGALILCEITP